MAADANELALTKPPVREDLAKDWPHVELHGRVLDAIRALPNHFETPLFIEGVPASDLFTLNSALGASIEEAMVDCLNGLREIWDPDGRYKLYRFVRQPQVFPDVRLQRNDDGAEPVLLGIELKGWFVLSKEGEPSFRYKVTPAACAPQDLLVIVPWVFKNVIAGRPILLTPLVESARYAALMRNHHWEYARDSKSVPGERGVRLAAHQAPYPAKRDKCSDEARNDSGGNFGRVARSGIAELDQGVRATMQGKVAGVPILAWHQFLRAVAQSQAATADDFAALVAKVALEPSCTATECREITDALKRLAQQIEAAASAVAASKKKSAKPDGKN